MINYFKGNTNIKRTRIDQIIWCTDLKISEWDDESIVGFMSKISKIANESAVLGKKYTEKSLGKKLMRYIPPRFEP